MTLHRAIIRFDSTSIDETIRIITRAAAKVRFTSAIDLVNKLEPAHLQSFWYFASKVNLAIIGTFGSLLWATSTDPEEAEFYKSQLAEYRWTLRVSSKAAEFMKFTVGMLDGSPVFMKALASKPSTPAVKQELATPTQQIDTRGQVLASEDRPMQYDTSGYATNEVSPSVGNSTENAYSYDPDINSTNSLDVSYDNRPQWSTFANNVNFNAGDIQDWSLDQLYNFENFPLADDIINSRRYIEEYDESGNNFAGF